MLQFTHESFPVRVVFGAGSVARLADEAARLGLERALVLSTPGQRRLAEQAAATLGARAAAIHAGAVMHVPVESVAAARAEAGRLGADGYVAIGGGSTIGLAKGLALETGLPVVAVPTTYAGSEMTPIYGLTEGGVKRTGRDERVRPRAVIYDPELTLSLPAAVAGPSGINALAHCVEALYAHDASPITLLIAEEGIGALSAGLAAVIADPGGLEGRAQALYGAWLASAALASATLGLHHKLCHTVGGSFNLPHAEVHTVILPHAAAYNAPAAPQALARAARALGARSAPAALFDLAASLGAPTSLAAIGMREGDLDRAADLATRSPYPNPAPVTREGVRRLLDDAFHGRRPNGATP
ncbi:MAG TPA: maleylacetate reductase [Chloroflexaceae bacterium]|nr:maleylacetate reductase [Chloroflexaceae bacterium]